jgi:serine/threonine protein kinase
LVDYIVNLSKFEEKSMICDSDEVRNDLYYRIEDEFLVFMKTKPLSENVDKSQIEHEIEKLINLRHPCITAPIGFVSRIESGNQQELTIVRMYLEGYSLFEVISVTPKWWTSTVKAKAIAGLVLGLRFDHSLGLFHGHLTSHNILFDSDHCIQIVEFGPIILEGIENESREVIPLVGFLGEGRTRERDIQAFASILFEVVFGSPPEGELSIPTGIPAFVSRIIESGLSPVLGTSYSFDTILDILKHNDFQRADNVGSAEVSSFVSWVESAEYPDK